MTLDEATQLLEKLGFHITNGLGYATMDVSMRCDRCSQTGSLPCRCSVISEDEVRRALPNRRSDGEPATISVARVEAVLRLISPDHITPMGRRMIQEVLDDA